MAAALVAGWLPFHNRVLKLLRHTLNSDSPPQLKELSREDKVRKRQLQTGFLEEAHLLLRSRVDGHTL